MVDGQVYAVLWSWMDIPQAAWDLVWRDDLGLPEVPWDAPQDELDAAKETARGIFTPLVVDIVARLGVSDLVPLVRDRSVVDPDAAPRALLSCDELFGTAEPSAFSTLSVLHLDLGHSDPTAAPLDATGILADGFTLYASSDSLYIAQTSWWWWNWADEQMTTTIHRFELTGEPERPVRYAATGEVPGWLLNQFCLSEHDGYLRVATTLFDWWWGTSRGEDEGSLVTVLEDNHRGTLTTVGQLDGLAPGERIYAARFMGDRGYLVTFVQVDPLFTLDLSDPKDPRVVGELEMPGYSAYLHPVNEDHLLAVGMAGDVDGSIHGLAVNLFDVSDFAEPALIQQYVFEDQDDAWSWSEALGDHHAFTFHRGVLSIPAYMWQQDQLFSGLLVLAVDVNEGISELGRIDHSDLPRPPDYPDYWHASMRRSLYIEDYLYSLSTLGLKVNLLNVPEAGVATVPFY
jgi:hypothetical protein